MTPEQFKQTWTINGEKLSPLKVDNLLGLNLKPSTIDFLTISGLPFDAAPFLSFVQDKSEFYKTINSLTKHYDFLDPEYDKYVVIGACNDGNIIAINTDENDRIVWLDHEDNFNSCYFNSSINCLADYLVIYRDFIQIIQEQNGVDAYINSDFNDSQFQNFTEKLKTADIKAITDEGFWKWDLETVLANRQENRK